MKEKGIFYWCKPKITNLNYKNFVFNPGSYSDCKTLRFYSRTDSIFLTTSGHFGKRSHQPSNINNNVPSFLLLKTKKMGTLDLVHVTLQS